MAIEKFKCNLQYILPHHVLSRILAKVADCKIPVVKNALIKLFIWHYKVDLNTAAVTKLSEYPSFNAFFTRALHESARPIAKDNEVIVSPADGIISQLGPIRDGRLLQAKGHCFSLEELLGGDATLAKIYQGGNFITVYLAPHNYHRVHMPLDGELIKTRYVPGRLFSVNNQSVTHIPKLFCRNERLIALFNTKIGELAIIMVAAMLVAGIETVWGQRETPCQSREIFEKNYRDKNIFLPKGQEMGRFLFGSTVILLFRADTMAFCDLDAQQDISMGIPIGHMI
jgi:phosphatidylserine decarboxylase